MDVKIDEYIKIYNTLGDELSKEYFEYLVMYGLTNDKKYIDRVARQANVTLISEKIRQLYKQEMFQYEKNVWEKVVNLLNYELEQNYVVICGAAGMHAKKILKYLNHKDTLILCDKCAEKKECRLEDITIISYEETVKRYSNGTYVILSDIYYKEIKNELLDRGIDEQNIVFVDTKSYKSILQNIGHFYVEETTCKNLIEETYFDKNIMKPEEKEIFIDCGFYDGISSKNFAKWCNHNYKKIIAFEPDSKNYEMACMIDDIERLELHNSGVWDENKLLNFKDGLGEASYIDGEGDSVICVETIDGVLKGNYCTFIKMDIEGAELNALYGAKHTIAEYHPKLAISIYHKPEDIIKIPIYILSLYPQYRFYIRHYTFNRCDTVLYAVI